MTRQVAMTMSKFVFLDDFGLKQISSTHFGTNGVDRPCSLC